MIYTTLCGPLSAIYVCGMWAIIFIPTTIGAILAVYLNTNVDPGSIGTGDITVAAVSTTLVGVDLVLLVACIWWRNIESYFSTFPWLARAATSQEKVGDRLYQTKCPFTGNYLALRALCSVPFSNNTHAINCYLQGKDQNTDAHPANAESTNLHFINLIGALC